MIPDSNRKLEFSPNSDEKRHLDCPMAKSVPLNLVSPQMMALLCAHCWEVAERDLPRVFKCMKEEGAACGKMIRGSLGQTRQGEDEDTSTLCNINRTNHPLSSSRTSSEVSPWSYFPVTGLRSGWMPWRGRMRRTELRPWSSKLSAPLPEAKAPGSPFFDLSHNSLSVSWKLKCVENQSGIIDSQNKNHKVLWRHLLK